MTVAIAPAMGSSFETAVPTDAGFTLLELLVSLAILSFTLMLLPQAVQLAGRAAATSSAIQRTQGHATVTGFVEERLAGSLPLRRREPDGTRPLAFSGSPGSVRFVAPVDTPAWGTGLLESEISLRDGHLWMRSRTFRPGAAYDEPWTTARDDMLMPATSFGLRYFGELEDGSRGWASDWRRADMFPEAMEMVIHAEPGAPAVRSVISLQPLRFP